MARGRGKRMYARKKLPMAKKRIDNSQNKAIVNLQKEVKDLKMRPELKYVDNTNTIDGIALTGELLLLNGLELGTDQSSVRIGAQVRMTSVQIRGIITTDPAQLTPVQVRVILFMDKQSNGTNPAVAGNPQSGNNPALLNNTVITNLVNAPYQHENVKRFKIFSDKVYTFNPQTEAIFTATNVTAFAGQSRYIKKHKKLGINVAYSQNTSTITSINKNALFLLLISNVASNEPDAIIDSRVYYQDS